MPQCSVNHATNQSKSNNESKFCFFLGPEVSLNWIFWVHIAHTTFGKFGVRIGLELLHAHIRLSCTLKVHFSGKMMAFCTPVTRPLKYMHSVRLLLEYDWLLTSHIARPSLYLEQIAERWSMESWSGDARDWLWGIACRGWLLVDLSLITSHEERTTKLNIMEYWLEWQWNCTPHTRLPNAISSVHHHL